MKNRILRAVEIYNSDSPEMEGTDRRSFVRRTGQGLLIGFAAIAGVGAAAERANAANANWACGCCNIAAGTECNPHDCSCMGGSGWWAWTCYRNNYAFNCYECYCDNCGWCELVHCCAPSPKSIGQPAGT